MLFNKSNKTKILTLEIHKPRIMIILSFDISREYIDINIGFVFFNFVFNKHFR